MGLIALTVFVVDQLTKMVVQRTLSIGDERVIIEGFFRLVHWTNRGAAWSLFNQASDSNLWLGIFAVFALVVLFLIRRHFDVHTLPGQIALGLVLGGIAGNLTDRFLEGHVTDFLYFYLERRGGGELGFPAFNFADTAICTGVALVFLMSWQKEGPDEPQPKRAPSPS
jgi:signal peptidase II